MSLLLRKKEIDLLMQTTKRIMEELDKGKEPNVLNINIHLAKSEADVEEIARQITKKIKEYQNESLLS